MSFPYYIIAHPHQALVPPSQSHEPLFLGYRGFRPLGFPRRTSPHLPLPAVIPRAEWAARIAELHGENLVDLFPLPAKDQNGLGYCWVYGATRVYEVEAARLGLGPLDLCPESAGGPLTHWRNEGGYASEAFAWIEVNGLASARLCPRPHELNQLLWDSRWKRDAEFHLAQRWYDIEAEDRYPTFAELVTCLLTPIPVAIGLGWWGHLVAALAALVLPQETDCPANTPSGDKVGILIQNSWGPHWPARNANGYAVLVESLATPDGAAAPIIVT
jgi:hypothetical protein